MEGGPVKVGIIGCGNISGAYLRMCRTLPALEIVAVADLVLERAQAQAAAFAVPRACGVEELLADPAIELVINLTIPKVHASVGQAVLAAGKSVYNEKPLGLERGEGQALLAAAAAANLRVGCAPDTFMGGGLQTCRALIDDGVIGTPVAATAFMLGHGPESWHPNPAIFYQHGAGPMFDMGPYYLTALVSLLGPVRRVTGATRITFPERMVTAEQNYGTMVPVETPTHVTGLLELEAGPIATIVTSFDVWASETPRIEIYGTEGTLSCPDPNTFGGPVRIRLAKDQAWREVPLTHGWTENCRGIGAADMAEALRTGRSHRASGELAFHVLDIMQTIHEAAETGQHLVLTSTCARPEPLPRSA